MQHWRRGIVRPQSTILEAIEVLNETAMQICLVADESDHLLGTLTDGDVRRGLLKGVALSDPVSQVMNVHPFTAHQNDERAAMVALMRREDLRHMPILDDGGRVVELASLTELSHPVSRPNWVVLMAGGEGQRLRPLTEDVPKPMIDVGGRPILETILTNFAACGFEHFLLSVNYKAEIVRNHFGDGSKWGLQIAYLEEDRKLGTAGALGLLPSIPDHDILVMNGDILTDVDFHHLLRFHSETGAVATMCVRTYDIEIPYGVVEADGHRLRGIREKPVLRNFVNGGIYVLSPAALDYLPKGQPFGMPDLFEALMADGRPCSVFPLREYWIDVGQLKDLDRARNDYVKIFD